MTQKNKRLRNVRNGILSVLTALAGCAGIFCLLPRKLSDAATFAVLAAAFLALGGSAMAALQKEKRRSPVCLALTVSLLAGCSKQLTPEEQAASEAAVLAQQLQDEEDQTGLKRLISNNITEYEQPFYDFVESLQEGDADKAATALGVPNTFGSNLQNWVIVNNYETFQKNELQHICFNSAKDGAAAVLNVYLKYPGEVTKDTSPDYVMNVDYVDGAWSLTPPTGVVKDYAFTTPTNKVSFEGTDLSSYASKSAETDVWTITLPRALDFEDGSTYVVTNDMGDFNAHIYDIKSDGKVMHMLLADIDADTQAGYQSKMEAVLKETYRLLSIGASEIDFSNVLLDSSEIEKCVPATLKNEDDVETADENARKTAIGASVTNVTVTPDDTLEGYPDAYTYRLSGNDGVVMNVKLKVTTTNGDARMKASIGMRLINGAWKIVSIDSSKDIFTELSVLDPEW